MATAGVDLVDAEGNSICATTAEVVAYSKVRCETKEGDIAAGQIGVTLGDDATQITCASADTARCSYSQVLETRADNWPLTTLVEKTSDTVITFTGTLFYTMGYTYKAAYYGIEADSVEVTSATSATATWNRGVPTTPSQDSGPRASHPTTPS